MKINITPEEFADLVVVFLFDKIVRNDEVIPEYEAFNEIVENLEKKGAKSPLMQYYLSLDAEERRNYKRINGAFTNGSQSNYTINIAMEKEKRNEDEQLTEAQEVDVEKEEEPSKKDVYFIKDIVKKTIQKMKSIKFRSAKKKVLTDDDLEKIIQKVIRDEQKR